MSRSGSPAPPPSSSPPDSRISADWLADRLRAAERALPSELQPSPALPDAAFEALARYVGRLLAWGERINLTGARSAEAVVDEHLADALPVLAQLPAGPFSGIDVGSGAGLPGVVLAVARPDSRWTLLEPNQKKAAFLAQVRRDLEGSAQLETLRERLEAHVKGAAGRYDVAVSRAVWDSEAWLEKGRSLVRPGGCLIGLRTDAGEPAPTGAQELRYQLAGRKRSLLRLDL